MFQIWASGTQPATPDPGGDPENARCGNFDIVLVGPVSYIFQLCTAPINCLMCPFLSVHAYRMLIGVAICAVVPDARLQVSAEFGGPFA